MIVAPRSAGRIARAALFGLLLATSSCAGVSPAASGVDAAAGDPRSLDLRLADATLHAGAPATTLHVTDEMLQRDPHDPAALLRRGQALQALGRPGDAAQSFAAAAAAAPTSLAALIGLARARADSGDAVDAEHAWRAALARAPGDQRVQVGLAVALDLQDRHAEAEALYRAVLARAPDDPAVRSDLGLSLALSGRAPDGLPLLRQAAAGAADATIGASVRERHNLAVGLVLAGDEPAARSLLSEDLAPAEVDAALAGLHQFALSQ